MNRNKFLKVLTFTMMLGIFSSTLNNVKAYSCESIINKLFDRRKSLSGDVRKYQDEMFDLDGGYNVEATIKSSEQYQNFMKIHGKNVNKDSAMFIFIILYIKNYESFNVFKNVYQIKEFIIKSLLNSRSREERRGDKIVSKLYQNTYGGSLGVEITSRYRDLVILQRTRK